MKIEFYRQIFEKIIKYKIFIKSVQWKPNFYMRKGGGTDKKQTDMTKLIVAFRNFANALIKCKSKETSCMQQGHRMTVEILLHW